MDFSGRTVLVTGANRGIGAATAALFLARGARVFLHGRSDDSLRGPAARLAAQYPDRVIPVAAELSNRAAIRAMTAKITDLDILVNSAGMLREATITGTDLRSLNDMIEVNVTAPWILTQALLPALRRKSGLIINVASDAAFLGYVNNVAYCATKGALVGLTRALAVELAPEVRTLAICPGPTETDMMLNAMKAGSDPDAVRQQWTSFTMLRRAADPAEIAEVIAFAASPGASYMTGSVIMVDGGASAGKRV